MESITAMNLQIVEELAKITKQKDQEKRKLEVYTQHTTSIDSKGVKKTKEVAKKAYDYFKGQYKLQSNKIEIELQKKRDEIDDLQEKLKRDIEAIVQSLTDKCSKKVKKLEKDIEFMEDEDNDVAIMRYKAGMIQNEIIMESEVVPQKTLGHRQVEYTIEHLEKEEKILKEKIVEIQGGIVDNENFKKFIEERRVEMNSITYNRMRANEKEHLNIAKQIQDNMRRELGKASDESDPDEHY